MPPVPLIKIREKEMNKSAGKTRQGKNLFDPDDNGHGSVSKLATSPDEASKSNAIKDQLEGKSPEQDEKKATIPLC